MDKITKMILFGEDMADDFAEDFAEELGGLDLGNIDLGLKDVGVEEEDIQKGQELEESTQTHNKGEKKLVIKKKLGHHKDEFVKPFDKVREKQHKEVESFAPLRSFQPQEKDLNLKLICVQSDEKIYRLSDLFIPKDERITKRIEKYNNKIMTLSEKLKQEKEPEQKKEVSDIVEMKHLIRKARRNQKFTKINVTYNEKFFLENIATDKLAATNTQQENLNVPVNQENQNLEQNLENVESSTENKLKLRYTPKLVDDKIVESNLLNSLFYVKMGLKNKESREKETTTQEEDVTMEESENQPQSEENFEEMEIMQLNNNIKESTIRLGENYMKNEDGKSASDENEIDSQTYVFNENIVKDQNAVNSINANLAQSIFQNPDFRMFSLNNSDLFKDIMKGDKNEKQTNINETMLLENKPLSVADIQMETSLVPAQKFEFKHEKDNIDTLDLFDMIKRKRHRAQGYTNEHMLTGTFMNCILLNDEFINENYKDISKKVYDLNDYNMNFEILKSENLEKQKKDKEAQLTQLRDLNATMSNGNLSTGEDFFTNLINQKLLSSSTQQPVLKIGKAKGNLLTHAKCAYNLTYNKINLTYDDLKDFHRPNFCKYLQKEKKKRNFSITISDKFNISNQSRNKRWDCTILTRSYLKKKEKKRISKNIQYMNAYEIFKDRYKLSLVDGKFCLFEHIDENPLFVSNFGMASKLKKFLYSSKLLNCNVTNSATKLSDVELKTYNMIGPYGIQIPLQPSQKLPLIGQIDQNESKGLAVVDNKMFRAPVFYEKLKNPVEQTKTQNSNKKYYNFLITFKKSKEGKEGFYIRELDHHYTVGQEEPKIEVYPPQSRQYLNFFKNKIKTYTYKLYDEIGYKAGINFKVFTNLFPNATEQILKKNFREMKIEIDKNICYFTKLPNEDNQMLITPENVCQFESCQFGIYKLREVGIKNLTNPDKISYATNKFINQTQDLKQQFLAKVIEEELLTTPWNITQNFLQAKQIKGMLAIKGIGDPSNGHGGYSFLKMPVKTYNDNKTLKEEIDQLKIMNKNIKTVTGTDADLRKLSKDDIKLKLIQLGEDEDYISKLSRWERVSLLRYKSSKAAELGYEGDITKYARGMRMNSKVQRDAYQKNINEVFKKQIQYITGGEGMISNYTDDSSDEEEEKNIYADTNPQEDEVPEEDKKKGLGFMRNEIYTNTNKKKKKESRRLGIISNDNSKKLDDGKIIKIYSKNNKEQNMIMPDENFPKIKLDMKSGMAEYLKRKKKSSQSFDNVYEYEMDKASTLVSRKRRDTPEKLFNELIEDIIDSCIKFDLTKIFHQPVKKKEYPDYYDIIKNTIDLGSMKNKTKRNEYKTISQFTDDLDLMVRNSSIYNGESHDVTLQGQKIRTHALNKLSEHGEKLQEMEKKVQEDSGSISIVNNAPN
jgi:hypothetical protein